VFIVGDSIRVVRRFSLPDVEGQGGNGVMPFPRVSNAAATADNADLDPAIAGNIVYVKLRLLHNYYLQCQTIFDLACHGSKKL
jgi:hypothetical protein